MLDLVTDGRATYSTDLPLERKAVLLSGQDFWSTPAVEEAGLAGGRAVLDVGKDRDPVAVGRVRYRARSGVLTCRAVT